MKLLEKILTVGFINSEKISDNEVINKIVLYRAFTYLGFYLSLLWGAFSILSNNFIIAAITLLYAVSLIINYNIFKRNNKFISTAIIHMTLTTILLPVLLFFTKDNIILLIWYTTFPPTAVFILGLKRGSFFTGILLLISSMIIFLPENTIFNLNIGNTVKFNFLLSYIVVFLIVCLFEYIRVNDITRFKNEEEDLEKLLKSKEDFISKLSHQIRTPLNNIMVLSDILNESKLNENQKDLIDTIQASTNNLANTLNEIVELTNIDIKQRTNYNLNFNLYSTINSTLKLFLNKQDDNAQFNFTIAEGIPTELKGDPIKIKQIFLNLIETILKNQTSKTTINVKIAKQEEYKNSINVYFSIETGGLDISAKTGTKSFISVSKDFTRTPGLINYINLLDLGITEKLIKQNNGKLDMNLAENHSLFEFTLSLNKSETEPSGDIKEKMASGRLIKEKTKIELNDTNILLVEDNLINQKIVLLSLKNLVKNIDVANNGKEALDKFGTSKYDIILMDVQMPIMNGIVSTKKIREIEASTNSHTPIIAITANALMGDKEDCLAAGMDDYISKPFQIEILIEKMKKQLD